jgi:hypothetical protein
MLADIDHMKFHGKERMSWKAAVVAWAKIAPDSIKPNVFKRYLVSLRQVRAELDHLYLDEVDRRVMAKIAKRKGVTNATRRRDLTAVSNVLRFDTTAPVPAPLGIPPQALVFICDLSGWRRCAPTQHRTVRTTT